MVPKNFFSNILLNYVTFQTTPSPGRVRLGQSVSDWSISTVIHYQPKLPTKSIKRDAPFPTPESKESRREQKKKQKREEPTKRSQREQTSRENEASHQQENLKSEELLATVEHSQTIASVF